MAKKPDGAKGRSQGHVAGAAKARGGAGAEDDAAQAKELKSRHADRRNADIKAIRAIGNRYAGLSLNQMSDPRGKKGLSVLDLCAEEFAARPNGRLRDKFWEDCAHTLGWSPAASGGAGEGGKASPPPRPCRRSSPRCARSCGTPFAPRAPRRTCRGSRDGRSSSSPSPRTR